MGNKRLVNFVQDVVLVLLALSAVFLFSRLPVFPRDLAIRFQDLLASGQPYSEQDEAKGLDQVFPAVHLAVTGESEYGRCVRFCAGPEDGLLRQFVPLFREALGSAAEVGATAERTLRQALSAPSLYLDLTEELPLPVVSAWLEAESEFDRPVCALALCAGEGDNAVLYLRSENGDVFRYYTALPASAVLELCEAYPPNGGRFAFESEGADLPPYVILPADTGEVPTVLSSLPAGATAYNLLTALDFNAHTLSRYTESSGVEVVEESPRTLRISPDGSVSFSNRGEASPALYQVPAAGDAPTALEAVRAAQRLAQALEEGTDASPLYLQAVEETEDGWLVRFRYQVDGVPVFFSDEADALSVSISGKAVTAFTYRSRSYLMGTSSSLLLPAAMAAAIASEEGGGGLSLGYVDSGTGTLSAQWLPY